MKLKLVLSSLVEILLLSIFIPLTLFSQEEKDWLNIGDVEFRQSNFQEALNAYSMHIEINPDDPRGYIHRARTNSVMGQDRAKALDLRIAQGLNPYSFMYLDTKSRLNNYAKKLYDFDENAMKASFTKSPLKYDDYVKYLEQVADNHSKDSLILLSISLLNDKRLLEAEKVIYSIQPNDANAALIDDLKGLLYFKGGDLQNAIDYFTAAINDNPEFAIAYHNRAICYKLLGDFDKANQDLKTALDLNNEISLFYFSLAKLNEKTNDVDAALGYYKKAIALDDEYKEAIINYSQLLKGLGEYETALNLLQKAIDKNPEEYEHYFLKANLHFVYGEFDEAIENYKTYLIKNNNDADAYYNMGLSNILARNNEQGCYDIEYSLRIESNDKRVEIFDSFCK
jgi:tetratricopeptide (TPR) repeat protein